MKQRVVAIAKARLTAPKTVEANQKAIDELPLNSGSWRVRGVPGLYVRARRVSKSFMLVRRVRGKLVQRIIGQMTLKAGASRGDETVDRPETDAGRRREDLR